MFLRCTSYFTKKYFFDTIHYCIYLFPLLSMVKKKKRASRKRVKRVVKTKRKKSRR